jgi:hypothetical protein
MEERVSRLERKLATLKGNVEGLNGIRVEIDNRMSKLTSDISGVYGTVA